jgi:hypothetical protein
MSKDKKKLVDGIKSIVMNDAVIKNDTLIDDIYPNNGAPSDHPPCCAKISLSYSTDKYGNKQFLKKNKMYFSFLFLYIPKIIFNYSKSLLYFFKININIYTRWSSWSLL